MRADTDHRLASFRRPSAPAAAIALALALAHSGPALTADEVCRPALIEAAKAKGGANEQAAILKQRYDAVAPKSGDDTAALAKARRFTDCIAEAIRPELAVIGALPPTKRDAVLAQIGFLGGRAFWSSPDDAFKDALRAASKTLKKEKPRDDALVFAVDSALSLEKNDFRAAVVAPSDDLAANPDELYRQHVARRKAAIEKALQDKTYDDGPLESIVRDIHAVTLEQLFFLTKPGAADQVRRNALIHAALAEYDAIVKLLDRAVDEGADNFGGFKPQHLANDYRYRRAIARLLANDPEGARADLADILAKANTWKPDAEIDHIYVEKYLRHPHGIKLKDSGGAVEVVSHDPNAVKRFLNPYQLAAETCSIFDLFKPDAFPYDGALAHLNAVQNRDFRIYLESGQDIGVLTKRKDLLNSQLKKPDMIRRLHDANADPSDPGERLKQGVSACLGKSEPAMDDIFMPPDLTLRGNWENWEKPAVKQVKAGGPRPKTMGIYLGGYLSKESAERVLTVLKSLSKGAYLGRPRLEG